MDKSPASHRSLPVLRRLACAWLLACATASSAHAVSLEFGAGMAWYDARGDGVWYQQGLPHSLSLQSPAAMIGVTGTVTPGWDWHVDAVDLGRATSDSWDTPDANYSLATQSCTTACPSSSLAHYMGRGGVAGLAVTLERTIERDNWHFGLEFGPWLYHSDWHVSVPNFAAARGIATNTPASFYLPWSADGNGAIWHDASGWGAGAVIGASVRRGALGLSLRCYYDPRDFPMSNGDAWPPLWRKQTVLMLTYRH